MPSESGHLRQAERNESLYADLCSLDSASEEYTEWEVVTLFYSALHYIDAYLANRLAHHPIGHVQRNRLVRMTSELVEIEHLYARLYRASTQTRYELRRPTVAEVRDIERNLFIPTKHHIRALLGV